MSENDSFETEEEPQQTLLSADTSKASIPKPLFGGGGDWSLTGMTSKSGHAVHSKVTKNGRTIYMIAGKDGKLRRASRYEIETGKKPPKCNDKPKGGVKKAKEKKGKSQYMQAKGKFMKESKRGKAIDKSKQAKKVVYSAKKYKPNQNDFGGLDTKR